MTDLTAFIVDQTHAANPPLVPEIRLRLADEVLALWRRIEQQQGKEGTPPPYWGFAWPGGQALARFLLDHPEHVQGLSVLDFGAGCGLGAIAAAKAGASAVTAADIDPFAIAAIALNAAANQAVVTPCQEDVIGRSQWQSILVGDMCYERPLAERLGEWLHAEAAKGVRILMGDPGRNYFSAEGLECLATYDVPTSLDLEDREMRTTGVYRLV